MVQIRDTGLESLSLGSRANAQVRTTGVERAMGVITGSPQSSPAPSTKDMSSRETTPMHVEENTTINSQASNEQDDSTEGDSMEGAEDTCAHRMLLDISADYDEDADEDYEPKADTTLDEYSNRVDTTSSEDDDSFSDIDINNIESSSHEDDHIEPPYHDTDPLCLDRLTEEEKVQIIDEARAMGIDHIIQKYILKGVYSVKKLLLITAPGEIVIGPKLTENDLIAILTRRLNQELRRRHRLPHIHTLDHVVQLLRQSKNIMVLTGAGVSVSCGIPDFRSSDGIYSRLSEFELEDPTQMFDMRFFCKKPQVFYSFAKEIFPSNFTPSPSHHFIRLLEEKGKLLRNYTQNIDTLEQKAGIFRVLQCHGSFATASCVCCQRKVPGDDIKEAILKQEVAYCKVCQGLGSSRLPRRRSHGMESGSEKDDDDDHDARPAVMKPDIVFFGERLPPEFDEKFEDDRDQADLLIVIGSSLKVAPVNDMMHQLSNDIPQILINRTPITHMDFDVQLLGNCDTIVAELCRMLGWELKHEKLPGGTSNVPDMNTNTNADGSGKGGRAYWSVIEPNTYTFEGAILGDIEYESSQSVSRKRGRIDNHDTEGYDADTDEEGRNARRRGSSGSDRRSSLGFIYSDSESDSEVSEGTIREPQQAMVSFSLESQSQTAPIQPPSSLDMTADTHLLQGSSSQDPEQPNFADSRTQRSGDDEDVDSYNMFMEELPVDIVELGQAIDLEESLNHSSGNGLAFHGHGPVHGVDRRMSTDIGPLLEDPRRGVDDVGDNGQSIDMTADSPGSECTFSQSSINSVVVATTSTTVETPEVPSRSEKQEHEEA
ncbi:NAD-dependent histone deacetylase sir2 [Modicella reniformis]|uniref:NAD-dependent histone deacetylase sir2 n=1 Tax=Modicella reniformis TaxID=1440133 RepID=A0A9P6J3C2_9FUNG|nr:NAD-dependent histone deacetylase sir2 [Modicella reniformis]